ncbi:MAG TPA: hypothetical protein VHO95_11710, partial [Candidatus Dormibacteraeota bacterium]|nr:hypothetical protein [Candidatus Dormibacteraeota bacterium]
MPDPSPGGATCVGCGSASVSGMAAAPDGSLWFFDTGKQTVARVTVKGQVSQFPVPATGAGSEAITVAPDGNVWMIAHNVSGKPDWLLRVSPTGAVTRFPIGPGPDGYSSGPDGIAIGPDHNVWFTEFFASRIGRLTPDGVVTEFPIETASGNPRGIVAGPDGNLWFTESSRSQVAIGRITPAGEMADFPVYPFNPDLNPTAIVAGPDGNLWFTGIGEVDRITTHGTVTRFQVAGHSFPGGITRGPDGNLWFTDPGANSVGRITPAGKIREFSMPRPNSQPTGIAVGGDGRIWFTEAGVSRIGSIGATVPTASLSSNILDFTDANRTETVLNAGDGPLRITSANIAGVDKALFHVTADTCSGHIVPVEGQCRIDISYAPGAQAGVEAARLEIADNA